MDIKELFAKATEHVIWRWMSPLPKKKPPFIRKAMPFIRNEKGFRYELDEETMHPKRVPRVRAELVDVPTGEAL